MNPPFRLLFCRVPQLVATRIVACLLFWAAPLLANPFISEFMADNGSTLADEDGEFPDWIEITNSGTEPVDLAGWHLTDDETKPTKWTFPVSTPLAGGQSLVVFASGKNRHRPGRQLHTNFALNQSGEFLALVAPDGATLASRFSPYPPQELDLSYGVGLGPAAVTTLLVEDDAQALLLVPSGPVDDSWRGGGPFNENSWTPVQLGVGFNTRGGAVIGGGGGETNIAYSVADGTSGTQVFRGGLGMDFAVLKSISVKKLGVFDDGSDGLNRTITAELWSRDGNGSGVVLASETFTSGSPGTLEAGHRFKSLSSPLTLEPGPYTIVAHGYGGDERNGNSGGNGDFTTSNDGGGLIQFVGSSRFGSAGGAWPDSEDGGGPARYGAGTFTFSAVGDSLIRTDLEAEMHGQNASALLRIPFSYAGPELATTLTLEIAYDDGFTAWLNGQLLTSRNASTDPAWNNAASGEGNAVETIVLPSSALTIGDNVLAVQGMNLHADDSDFLVAPQLSAAFSRFERLYFSHPTPGQPNGPGEQGTGIVINEIHYDPSSDTAPAEFLELYNAGARTVNLTGWRLTGAVDYTFPANTELAPDRYLVVALDASFFEAEFSGVPVHGPFLGRLSNSGETVELRNNLDEPIDRVNYAVGAPWPVAGDDAYPSIQLLHPGQDNDLAGSWRAAPPTPGALNAVFSVDTPPQVRQVNHLPLAPTSGEEVVVSCKVTDPDGVASVTLEYQTVLPGRYLRLSDATFETSWDRLPMSLLPTGQSTYQATLPADLQRHRQLIRYRIVAEDSFGATVRLPLPSDPSVNFAYFVYNGVPGWRGAIIPGETPVLDFSAEAMNHLPTYHLIANAEDVSASQYNRSFNDKVYRFEGALVYDGVVYDHMRYRVRGHGSTYNTGKNKWKLRFNRGHLFQGRDDYGRPYREKVRTLNWSALSSPWNPANRGAAGLDEALAFRLWRMAGIPAANTNYFHLRIIDGTRETTRGNQFEGDNWGLYLALEQTDRRFLDERGLPDGNTFNMHFGSSNIVNQAYRQPSNRSDLFTFYGATTRGYNRSNPVQPVAWWNRTVDLESYFSYRAILEAVNHSDLRDKENSILYHDPTKRRWTMIPWDVDLLYEEFDRWGPNAVQSPATLEQFRKALTHPEINIRFQNRARELQDLLLNSDQGWTLVDELASILGSSQGDLGMAELDAARWNGDPQTRRVEGSSPNPKAYFFMNPYTSTRFPSKKRTLISGDFPGMVDWVKKFIEPRGFGGGRLRDMIRDTRIPKTPVISYAGENGFPSDGLRLTSNAFESGDGGASFATMQWRIGEVRHPGVPGFEEGEPWRYEIEATWTSGEVNVFQDEITVPAVAVEVGRRYRARVRHKDDDGRWSHWSAPLEFTTGNPDLELYLAGLVISEVMYNPANDNQELEFIEVRNVGPLTLDLTNVRFSNGIEFSFAGSSITSLAPGTSALVVRNLAVFEAHYGINLPVAGEYRLSTSNNLSNSGERVTLSLGADGIIRDFRYGDSLRWPRGADGTGYSLVLRAPESLPDHSLAVNWRSSALPDGNPGNSDAIPAFTGDPHRDDDLDGLTALLEHALGGDPDTAEPELIPAASVMNLEVEGTFDAYLTISARRVLGADDVNLVAQISENLVDWSSAPERVVLVSEVPNADSTSTMTWRSARPIAEAPHEFLRMEASIQRFPFR